MEHLDDFGPLDRVEISNGRGMGTVIEVRDGRVTVMVDDYVASNTFEPHELTVVSK